MYESAILLMIASLLPRGTMAGNPDGDVTGMSLGWLKQEVSQNMREINYSGSFVINIDHKLPTVLILLCFDIFRQLW